MAKKRGHRQRRAKIRKCVISISLARAKQTHGARTYQHIATLARAAAAAATNIIGGAAWHIGAARVPASRVYKTSSAAARAPRIFTMASQRLAALQRQRTRAS